MLFSLRIFRTAHSDKMLWYICLILKVKDILPELSFEVDSGKTDFPMSGVEDEIACYSIYLFALYYNVFGRISLSSEHCLEESACKMTIMLTFE